MARRTTKRVLVILHFLKMSVPEFLIWSKASIDMLQIDPDITPVVPVSDLSTQLSNLQTTVNTRQIEKASYLTNRQSSQLTILLNSFTYVAGQVEMIANDHFASDESSARAFIQRIGFNPKKEAVRDGNYFRIIETGPGFAYLQTKAAERNKRALYCWRYSTNPLDPQSWSQPFTTSGSSIILSGLQRDTRYYFQEAKLVLPGRKPNIHVEHNVLSWGDAISGVVV